MKARILKKLTNDGKDLEVGTIVDVSEWRNAKSLEGSRYITFVSDSEVTATVTVPKKKAAVK